MSLLVGRTVNDSQIVRAKENLKLSYGGHSQKQASGTNQRMIALRQGWHCVWIVSEYEQGIPQSQTADKAVASWGSDT